MGLFIVSVFGANSVCTGLGVSDGEEMVVTLTERQASRGETRIARQGRVSLGELLGHLHFHFSLLMCLFWTSGADS